MLTVRSSVVSRAIPYKEVAFVAKTAQEQALTGVEEPPQETGICERFVDTIFCGGVKKTAKSRIHGMSHHTASLHLELQKPSEERNSGLIKTHIEKISENQKRLYGLMQGDTLEFGSVEERPVVGKDSYLIHRSPAKICPTGIPLYKPEHEDYSSIPTFKSAADIRAEDIPAIRHSGKTSNQGMINCEGAIYQIHFSELNTPEIIYSMEDQQCESLQRRLYELWQTNERHFSFNPPEQSVSYRDIHGEAQVFFKIRIFRLCELITEFAMLKQDDEATKKFKIFCEDQLEFLQQFSLSEFEELINPPKIKSWKYRNIHPPIFQAQHEILFNMLKDPAILWDQIDLAMRRLRIEQDAQIELRIRQIELGYKLERRLNTALTNGHGNRIIASQGNFSPEYIHRMDMLEQTRRDLLSPGKNFRQLELINLSTTIDRNLFLAEVECRRNGFEAGVMVRNAEIGQPIRANPI